MRLFDFCLEIQNGRYHSHVSLQYQATCSQLLSNTVKINLSGTVKLPYSVQNFVNKQTNKRTSKTNNNKKRPQWAVMCWTVSWPVTVTSWSLVATMRLPGNQWRLQEFAKESSCCPIQRSYPSKGVFVDRLWHSGATKVVPFCWRNPSQWKIQLVDPLRPNITSNNLFFSSEHNKGSSGG